MRVLRCCSRKSHHVTVKAEIFGVQYFRYSPTSAVRGRELFGKPVFQVSVLALVLKFSVRFIFGKNVGTEVTENITPPKSSALTVVECCALHRFQSPVSTDPGQHSAWHVLG